MKMMEGITEQMAKAISLLVWTDKSKQEIADEVGIDRVSLWRWYKRDDFMNELQKERRNKFVVFGDVASKELLKLVKDDSDKRTQLQAIKMILGENGLCNDSLRIDNNTTTEFIISYINNDENEEE